MNITLPAALADGDTLTAAKYNAPWTALTGYTIALSDLATQHAPHTIVIPASSIASGSTYVMRMKVPTTETWYPVQAEVSYQSGVTPTVAFQFTDDASNVITTAPQATAPATLSTLVTSGGFAISTIAGGSELVFTLTCSGGATATNATGVVHFKVKLTA